MGNNGKLGYLIFLWALLVAVVAMATEHRPFERTKGINGLEKIIVKDRRGRSFEVYLYGGQVTSWKNEKGEDLLFMSSKLPSNISYVAWVDLILRSSQDDLKIWPHKFEYRLRIHLGPEGDLTLTSRVKNTDVKLFNFTSGFHPYFSVSDIRLYLSTPNDIRIVDPKKKKTLVVHKEGQVDAVVWNPWEKKVSDLGVKDYKRFVAVEPVAVAKPITVNPGQEWKGTFQMTVVPST
ncbi:unnamed protein product [Thlaspi arvense]|uniref:Glucose-6-phosphate 1-epimerase n=1 Tax=Thlaspi arvense TaxID=13288 RepID=A0AAU9T3Y8_THLAR|nr:unnamed protein product [Thlaspi arvense]